MKRPEQGIIILVVLVLAAALLPAPVLAAGSGTTELHIVKYANDETTVLNETTVDYHWLEKNLPVQGDGVTRYYHQGPVFEGTWEETHPGEPYDGWNPDEDVLMSMLVKADLGAVKGTDIRDICDYIGGAEEGDGITICSRDGWRKTYPYSIIYEPDPRQGPAVLCWYSGNTSGPDAQEAQGQGYPDTGYVVGMRMIFFADTSTNPWGWHVFGNTDMKECWDEDYWNYGGDYPSAAGTSGKWINEIRIYSQEEPPEPPVAGFTANVTSGAIPLAVAFTDTSEGDPTSWAWDFGDGNTSADQNPVHTYTVPGTYTVSLEVTYPAGSSSVTKDKFITASSGGSGDTGGDSSGGSDSSTPVTGNATATPDDFTGEILENRTFLPGVPGIERIVVFAPEIPENLTISCETIDLPEGIPEPPGEVYRYYNITPGGVNVTIGEALILFGVPDTWIQENRIDSSNLSLYRYANTWTVLQTRWTGTVNGTRIYEAASPGFSLFAISGKQVEPTPAATVTPVQTSTPAVSGTPANGTGTSKGPLMPAFGHIAAVPVLAGGLPGRLFDAVSAFLVLFNIIPAGSAHAADPGQVPAETLPVTDPVPAEPAPVPAADIVTMRFNLLVLSDPPGALIDLDGEYTGKTTPASFASLPGGNHSVRVRMDGVEPEERMVVLERDDEILVELTGTAAGSPGPLRDWDQNHYGGVYVASYPEGADILVDGQKANRKTPCVIYGLKEGLHTIKVQKGKTVFASEKERVWVDRNSVTRLMFTGGNAGLVHSIRFESDEYTKKSFSLNGRYLGYAFPKTVDVRGIVGSYITVADGESYLTYRIPATVESNDTVTPVFSDAPCSMLVTSVPAGAAISVDGFLTGYATPYVIADVSAGKHLVSVSKPGYIPAEQEITLTDNPGDACDATVKFTLEPYTWGSLAVSSTPEGARIYLFGRDTGEVTPHTFHYLNIGSYPVKVVGESGSKTIEDVVVSPYATTDCHADLGGA